MTKRANTNNSHVCALIIDPNVFRSHIEERIALGKELLNISVSKKSIDPYFGYAPRSGTVKYDEKEQNSFLEKYRKWNSYNSEYLKRAFDIPENDYKQEYESTYQMWSIVSDDIVEDEKKTISLKINMLESLIERLPLISYNKTPTLKTTSKEYVISNKIFIVHGHNEAIKEKVARTLTKLKLEPIILHEQADGGRTIIEKFEANSSNVGFAVILLTADDICKAKNDADYKNRARQNVVFEMGYFIGKLGRNRVFLLLEQGVEKPGDLDGIVYTLIDNNEGWKLKLVKELKACNYSVSADNLM